MHLDYAVTIKYASQNHKTTVPTCATELPSSVNFARARVSATFACDRRRIQYYIRPCIYFRKPTRAHARATRLRKLQRACCTAAYHSTDTLKTSS